MMSDKEMIESAANDWLCNRTGKCVADDDDLIHAFETGAEWAFGKAAAVHYEEQSGWREGRLKLGVISGDDAAKMARTLWDLSNGIGHMTRREAGEAARVVEFLWNDLGEVRQLVAEAAVLFRSYEAHHLDIAKRSGARTGREEKAKRNGDAAAKLERWLAGDDTSPAAVMRDFDGCTTRDQAEVMRQTETARLQGEARRYLPGYVHPLYDEKCGYRPEDENPRIERIVPEEVGHSLEDCRARFETGPFKGFPIVDVEQTRQAAQRIAERDLETIRSNVRPVIDHPLAEPDLVEGIMGALDSRRSLSLATDGSFRLQTADPRFDPEMPVRVNGYLYYPTTPRRN